MSARLECPLCATVIADGVDDIAADVCPGCGARYEGGMGDAPAAVAQAMLAFGSDLDPGAVLDAAFRLTPDESRERGIAVTSDERDDFYRWWLFVRATDPAAALAYLLGR